jgi:putative nucleotidyltransferase with HDIG domain
MEKQFEFCSVWSEFLESLRPKLLADELQKERMGERRRIADLRLDVLATRQGALSLKDVAQSVVTSPDRPDFMVLAFECGLLSPAEQAAQHPRGAREIGIFLEVSLVAEFFPVEEVIRLLKGFARKMFVSSARDQIRRTEERVEEVLQGAPEIPEKISTLLSKVKGLWGVPSLVQQLQKMLLDPDTPVGAVALRIEKDAGLAAQVLRVVNSALFGLSSKVTSISRAVTILGYKTTQRIVSVAALLNKMGREDPEIEYDLQTHWSHSLWIGHGAAQVARLTQAGHPDDFFSAGLLHDIGKLIEYQYLKPMMKQILLAVGQGAALEEIEQRVLGANHAAIGAYVCQQWGFPEALVASVRDHLRLPEVFERGDRSKEALSVAAMCAISKGEEAASAWAPLLKLSQDSVLEASREGQRRSLGAIRDVFTVGEEAR